MKINHFRKLNFIITIIALIFILMASNAWAANGAETGTIVMFRIHPILGIITLIGAIAAIGRMAGN